MEKNKKVPGKLILVNLCPVLSSEDMDSKCITSSKEIMENNTYKGICKLGYSHVH